MDTELGSFLYSTQETVTVDLAGHSSLFYCVSSDVSLNSPSYLWDGTINLIKFLSPCKNVYIYAHLGNTLLITRLLNMDSELLLLLLFFFLRNIFISLFLFHQPLPIVNIKVQNFTGFKLAIEANQGARIRGKTLNTSINNPWLGY